MTPTPKTIRGSEYELLTRPCHGCDEAEGCYHISGNWHCESCAEVYGVSEKVIEREVDMYVAQAEERIGRGFERARHAAAEFMEGR